MPLGLNVSVPDSVDNDWPVRAHPPSLARTHSVAVFKPLTASVMPLQVTGMAVARAIAGDVAVPTTGGVVSKTVAEAYGTARLAGAAT